MISRGALQPQIFCDAVPASSRKLKIKTGKGRKGRAKTVLLHISVLSVEIEIGKEHLKGQKISSSFLACCVYNVLRVITG